MIALLTGATTLAFAVVGWYGYKAYLRIETWGRNMNEIEGIYQEDILPDTRLNPYPERRHDAVGIALVPSLKIPHHRA